MANESKDQHDSLAKEAGEIEEDLTGRVGSKLRGKLMFHNHEIGPRGAEITDKLVSSVKGVLDKAAKDLNKSIWSELYPNKSRSNSAVSTLKSDKSG